MLKGKRMIDEEDVEDARTFYAVYSFSFLKKKIKLRYLENFSQPQRKFYRRPAEASLDSKEPVPHSRSPEQIPTALFVRRGPGVGALESSAATAPSSLRNEANCLSHDGLGL